MAEQHRIKLLPKQREFVFADDRECLYSGAWGAGKSYALCTKAARRAVHKGAREGLFRLTNTQLRKTTLVTLLDGDGKQPPVLPPGSYEHRKSDQIIEIHDGGKIIYGDLEEDRKIGSLNLTGANVDECLEVPERTYTALLGRIRVSVPGIPNQINAACNPGGPHHYLAKRFGLALDHRPAEGCKAVRTETADNPHLPPGYLVSLNQLTGVVWKKNVKGLWVSAEGLVYDHWNPELHVRVPVGYDRRTIIGVDYGVTNPFAAVRLGVDGDGRVAVTAERYESGLRPAQMVQAVIGMGGMEAEAVMVDPSATALIMAMRDAGLPAMEANNEVMPGIGRVADRLAVDAEGVPRLIVAPDCRFTTAEFESYEWQKDTRGDTLKDKPKKESDHAMDALRYAIARLDGTSATICTVVTPGAVRASAPTDGETLRQQFERLRADPNWGFDE